MIKENHLNLLSFQLLSPQFLIFTPTLKEGGIEILVHVANQLIILSDIEIVESWKMLE